jgi:hypothetical protein
MATLGEMNSYRYHFRRLTRVRCVNYFCPILGVLPLGLVLAQYGSRLQAAVPFP